MEKGLPRDKIYKRSVLSTFVLMILTSNFILAALHPEQDFGHCGLFECNIRFRESKNEFLRKHYIL